ncbi:MAG: DUF4115 domain-containing protein [Rubrivivax sp.]
MTDSVTPPPAGTTAGALLRAAREKQGLHIAALAAAIKVPVAKLEALEDDRHDELLDPAFTRALALAVCRALHTDAQPVLALLPRTDGSALDHVVGSLNTPFRERAGPDMPKVSLGSVKPLVWAGGVLLVAAAVVYFLPAGMLQPPAPAPAAEAGPAPEAVMPPEAAASEPEVALAPVAEPSQAASVAVVAVPAVVPASAPAPAASAALPAAKTPAASTLAAASTPASAVPASAALVQLHAEQPSWIEAYDAKGQVVFSRLLRAGESAGVDGQLPLRLKIGNAPATRLSFRGKPVDLEPLTRNAVARVELQ